MHPLCSPPKMRKTPHRWPKIRGTRPSRLRIARTLTWKWLHGKTTPFLQDTQDLSSLFMLCFQKAGWVFDSPLLYIWTGRSGGLSRTTDAYTLLRRQWKNLTQGVWGCRVPQLHGRWLGVQWKNTARKHPPIIPNNTMSFPAQVMFASQAEPARINIRVPVWALLAGYAISE